MDLFDDINTRYQWIKLTKQVPDKESGGAAALVNQDLLCQYGLIDLDAIKRHANHYFSNDATTNDVPAPNVMTRHQQQSSRIFYNHT
eukprot:2598037-Ditylum_brightwellii.AAC.1